MQTPYIITRIDTADTPVWDVNAPDRVRVVHDCGPFRFYFFPPDEPKMLADLDARLHIDGESLWFEEGFMLRYPDPYEPDVSRKLDQFDLPSIALDGAFSRITVAEGTLKIDGSATYLQMLCSCTVNGQFYFSNNQPLLQDMLALAGQELTLNEHFMASHLAQVPLAYFIFAGTQWSEIDFHDSMDTILYDSAGGLRTHMVNKLSDPAFEALDRDARLDLLYQRLQHTIDEYANWTGTDTFTHHLTAGRDSRMSFAMFKKAQGEKLLLMTGGYPHTTDKVIANYIAKQYGIKQVIHETDYSTNGFDYTALLNTTHAYRYQVATFRRQVYLTDFNSDLAIANGYLGNLMTYTGAKERQMLPLEKSALTPDMHAKLDTIYDRHIAQIGAAYGEEFAFRMFNLKFNTTNKVSSVIGRMRKFFFCLFESDLLFLAYMRENTADMHANSIHYEMMRRADPALLHMIPFEPGKSFTGVGHTSEVVDFKGIKRIGEHRKFIAANFDAIIAHIRACGHRLQFYRTAYLDDVAAMDPATLPEPAVNKLFAILGGLEMSGYPLDSYEQVAGENNTAADIYTPDLFQQMYFDHALHASGLPGMVYAHSGTYRSFARVPEDEELRVTIVRPGYKGQEVEVTRQDDGHTIHFKLECDGRYRVMHFAYHHESKRKTELFRSTFVAQKLHVENLP